MAGLLTVEQLQQKRKEKLEAIKLKQASNASSSVHGSMSDDNEHTVTVNTPPEPAILSVVSWNVQTFEAGKSLSSPFANLVINRILEDLAVDVCVLLETRADSYVNMNAIETGEIGQGNWKAVSEEADLEDDDESGGESDFEEEDMDDTVQDAVDQGDDTHMEVSDSADSTDADDADTSPDDYLAAVDGGDPLRYAQMVSEMTGKRWVPPSTLYVYHPHWVERARLGSQLVAYDLLYDKLRELTGRSRKRIETLLQGAFTAKTQRDGKKLIMAFVNRNNGNYKGRKKFSEKNAGALLRMYTANQKAPTRFDPVKAASAAEKTFCESYSRHPVWLKRWAVDSTGPIDLWKQVLLSPECLPVRLYYEPFYVKDDFKEAQLANWDDVKQLPTQDSWRYVLRIRRCPGCDKSLGTGACDQVIHDTLTCQAMGALSTSLGNLRGCINEITFYRGCVQESYSLLVRQSTTLSAPSQDGVWLNGKRVQMSWFQSGLLMYAPASKADSAANKTGHLLGYQGSTKFYGRCPYKAPLDLWLYDGQEKIRLALIAFHGPYGDNSVQGVKARAASMDELMKADMGSGFALQDTDHALVMGDFNLDWQDAKIKGQKEDVARQLYKRFQDQGFVPLVDQGTATSLKSIFDKKQAWKTYNSGDTANFTSSAYDNMFLKGKALHEQTANAAVIDVIAWIEANIGDFKLGPEHAPPDGFDGLPARNRAFYIYHKYVSDHLPIIYDLVVQGMPDDSEAAKQAQQLMQRLRQKAAQERRFSYDIVMSYETLVDIEPAPGQAHSYDKKWEGEALRGWIVGDIDSHQDGQLVIRCQPGFDPHVGWLSVQLTRNGKPAGGLFLKRFLELHPPGMRVKVEVLNPKPVG